MRAAKPKPWHPLHQPSPYPSNEADRVNALLAEGLLDTEADEELDGFVEIGRRAFGVRICAINFIDSDRQWSKARRGLEPQEIDRDISICSHCILSANSGTESFSKKLPADELVVLDTVKDKRFVYSEMVSNLQRVRFYAGVPLCVMRARKRLAIGTFCIMDQEPRQDFSDSDREMMAVMGAAIMAHIETSRRPMAQGPLASPYLDGGLSMRVKVLQKCTAVVARQVAESALKILAECLRPRIYQKGHYITKKGMPGDSMYFITTGSVAVSVEGRILEMHGALQSFGEIALINLVMMTTSGVPEEQARERCVRGADIQALERCELLELCYEEVIPLIRVAPNLWFTLQDMAHKRAARQERHSQSPEVRPNVDETASNSRVPPILKYRSKSSDNLEQLANEKKDRADRRLESL
eukprot:Tamp_07063.p1 GENE.Tamp_07063~~Tamp_07063.p1  ORF type:complete len:480 (+),score=48.43 Tamp_07063:206-1441(+)